MSELMHAAGLAPFTVIVIRKDFVAALAIAKKVTERRNTIPILSNVMLRVDSADALQVIATDLDLESRQEMPCEAPQAGALTVNGHTLDSTVRKMKGEFVRLQAMGGGSVALTDLKSDLTPGSTVRLPSLPADDFPALASFEPAAKFELDARELAETIATVKPAVSTEETRYYLNGIFIHPYCERPAERTAEHEALCDELAALRAAERGALDDCDAEGVRTEEQAAKLAAIKERVAAREAEIGERIDVLEAERTAPDTLRFAATDGHRMFVWGRPLPVGADNAPRIILPRKACGLVASIIGKASLEAHVALSESKFSIRVGRITIRGKLIDGTFPDYTRVIPSQNEGRLVIDDASAFRAAVETVAAVCTERTRAMLCSMTGEYVTLYASSPEFGKSGLIVEGASYAGDDLPLGMNARYLMDALGAFDSDPVTVQTSDPAAPMRFGSDAKPGLIIVLMPMRVDGTLFTPAAVRGLTLNPVEALQTTGADCIAAIAEMRRMRADPDPSRRPGWAAIDYAQRDLGRMASAASEWLASGKADRLTVRWQVKLIIANAAGDERGRRIAGEFLSHLIAGPSGSFKALGEPRRSPPARPAPERQPTPNPDRPVLPPEPVELPVPEPVCIAAAPEAEPEPEIAAQPVQEAAQGAIEPEAVPEAMPAAAEASDARAPAKIADAYGRVFYVVVDDYEGDGRYCRRVHKDGAPFCDSEAKGGAWQRIPRENIARRILPRGTCEKPAKILTAAPAGGNEIAERVAALELLVARLAAGEAVGMAPAATSEAVAADVAARAGRMVVAQGDDESFDEFVTRLGSVEAAGRELRNDQDRANRELRDDAVRLRARVAELVAEGQRLRAATVHGDEAKARADRLQVRCDALEAHAAASERLDRAAPDDGLNGHIIVPAVRSRPRAADAPAQ